MTPIRRIVRGRAGINELMTRIRRNRPWEGWHQRTGDADQTDWSGWNGSFRVAREIVDRGRLRRSWIKPARVCVPWGQVGHGARGTPTTAGIAARYEGGSLPSSDPSHPCNPFIHLLMPVVARMPAGPLNSLVPVDARMCGATSTVCCPPPRRSRGHGQPLMPVAAPMVSEHTERLQPRHIHQALYSRPFHATARPRPIAVRTM